MAYTPKSDTKIIEKAKKQFKAIVDYESIQREQMKDDRRFFLGYQWTGDTRKERESTDFKRPTLTVNRTKQFIDYVSNQQRQNKPSPKVTPKDDGAQETYAKNRAAVMKHILNDSKASLAFQKAFDDALIEGRGHCIINSMYTSDSSFDQKIIVDAVKNPRDIYMDPRRQLVDYSDCKHGFYLERMDRDQYKEEFPKFPVADWQAAEHNSTWVDEKEVIIAQYWVLEEKDDTLITASLMVDGQKITTTKFKSEFKEPVPEENIEDQRKVKRKVWQWYKMNADHILDRRTLVCKDIPIITCIGVEDHDEGELVLKGMVRDLKDSGRMYNFYVSQEAEVIGQSPKSPFIGAIGQFEGLEKIWANANNTPTGFLPYKPISSQGVAVPPPQRVQPPQVPVAYIQAKVDIIEDMKGVSGLQNANFGGRSNETSGVAIRERKTEGNTSNYHFPDNYTSALSHAGRVINQMMPTYYPPGTIVSIMGEEDEVKTKELGKLELSEEFSLGDGEFDVICEVGPSFATQRQEAASNMIDTARFVPTIGQSAPDIIVKAMDWPMKDKIAERAKEFLKVTVPGMSLEDKDEVDQEAMLENQLMQAQQQMQQMQQQMMQMQEALQKVDQQKLKMDEATINDNAQRTMIEQQKVEQEMQIKTQELQLKAQEIKVDAMKVDITENTKLEIAQMNNQTQEGIAVLNVQSDIEGREGQLTIENKRIDSDLARHQDHNESERQRQKTELAGITKAISDLQKPQVPKQAPEPKQAINITNVIPEKKPARITKTDDGYKVTPDD